MAAPHELTGPATPPNPAGPVSITNEERDEGVTTVDGLEELTGVCHALGIDVTVEEPGDDEAEGRPVVWFKRGRDAERFGQLVGEGRQWAWEYAPFPASVAFWMPWRSSVAIETADLPRVVASLKEVVASGG